MSITQDHPSTLSPWAIAVAREVRKMLAAREIPVTDLDGLAGKNRMYWQRRIRKPSVALDINDLAVLADRFEREITSFFPDNPVTSDYKAIVRPVASIDRPRRRRDTTRPATRAA